MKITNLVMDDFRFRLLEQSYWRSVLGVCSFLDLGFASFLAYSCVTSYSGFAACAARTSPRNSGTAPVPSNQRFQLGRHDPSVWWCWVS